MPLLEFRRCQYVSSESIECENTFPVMDSENKIRCELHANILNEALASESEEIKDDYIQVRKEEELNVLAIFAHEGFDGLDRHIAGIETIVEKMRMKYAVARGVRQNKLLDLSDEERKVRQKIKVQTPDNKPQVSKKVTAKSDPIRYFMQTFNMTEKQAQEMVKGMGKI